MDSTIAESMNARKLVLTCQEFADFRKIIIVAGMLEEFLKNDVCQNIAEKKMSEHAELSTSCHSKIDLKLVDHDYELELLC